MKAPRYKLEKSEEAETLSQIMAADKTPLRYIRSRARHYARLWVMSDSYTRGVFENADKRVFDLDELFVLFDKRGLPLCVSVSGESVRILHADGLFEITANKGKITRNPRKLYLAYLDMFPQSALNMDAFVKERKQYFLAPENCNYDSVWTAVTEGESKIYFSLNAAKSGVEIWKLHKILFELDKNFKISTVYSAAGKTYGKYVTRAQVVAAGENVISQLKAALKDFPIAEEIIEEIYET